MQSARVEGVIAIPIVHKQGVSTDFAISCRKAYINSTALNVPIALCVRRTSSTAPLKPALNTACLVVVNDDDIVMEMNIAWWFIENEYGIP